MVDSVTKYHLVPNGTVLSDFALFRTRKRSSVLLYGVVLVFVVFTVFVALTPSSSSPFLNIFTLNSTSPQDESYRSHVPSIFSYFFPNLSTDSQISQPRSHNIATSPLPSLENSMVNQIPPDKGKNFEPNNNKSPVSSGKDQNFEQSCKDETCNGNNHSNETQINPSRSQNIAKSQVPTSQNSTKNPISSSEAQNFEQSCKDVTCNDNKHSSETQINPSRSQNITKSQVPNSNNSTNPQVSQEKGEQQSKQSINTPQISQTPQNSTKGGNGVEDKGVREKVVASDFAASLSKKENELQEGKKQGNLIGSLVDCDLYDGEWVRDDSYPLYKPGSCPLIDEQFNCISNGRPDSDYHKLKWKPKGCTLPRVSSTGEAWVYSLVVIGSSPLQPPGFPGR